MDGMAERGKVGGLKGLGPRVSSLCVNVSAIRAGSFGRAITVTAGMSRSFVLWRNVFGARACVEVCCWAGNAHSVGPSQLSRLSLTPEDLGTRSALHRR